MIKTYVNGEDFINDNKVFLNTNPYLAVFFYWDAPLLKEANKINYAFKVIQNDKQLLAVKVEPYNLLLFGEVSCVEELIDYLMLNGYEIKNILCESNVGYQFAQVFQSKYNAKYNETLAMDFMEANEISEPSTEEVKPASIDDLDEIFELLGYFLNDCGLLDKINKEKLQQSITCFKVIRRDGKIASLAKLEDYSPTSMKITDVYTRNEYRGHGFAKKIVNTLKNEAINKGKIATLNVDRRNPITNHIYTSIGFKRVFSQGEFRKEQFNG